MTISVSESAKALIDKQAARAGYASSADYLLSLVERDRNRALREEIETKLSEALASKSSPMTRQDWDDIRVWGIEDLSAQVEERDLQAIEDVATKRGKYQKSPK